MSRLRLSVLGSIKWNMNLTKLCGEGKNGWGWLSARIVATKEKSYAKTAWVTAYVL